MRAFTLTRILQLNLDGKTHMKNRTLIFNSFCKINNFTSLNKIYIDFCSIRTIKTLGTRSVIILKKFWFFWLNHQNTFPIDLSQCLSVSAKVLFDSKFFFFFFRYLFFTVFRIFYNFPHVLLGKRILTTKLCLKYVLHW